MSARDRIREYFEKNIGKVINTREIREVAGINDYARRIRELRDEEGMQIKTHIDRSDLKPGEYLLESLVRLPVIARNVSPQLRMDILERNGFTCQLCGAGAGDRDPWNPNRKIRLHIDHIIPLSQGGLNTKENLRVVCSACNQAKSNIQPPSESARNILIRIRRMPRSVKKEIYEALKRSFSD